MIEFLSGWAKNLGVVIVIVSIFEMIVPNNKTKKYIRVVLGIFVMFNIISPFIKNKDKLSSVSIDLENYTTEQNVTVDQTSMDKRIQDLYEKELEKDIKNKIEEQGYKVASCKVNATILENENSNSEENTIQKIKLKIEKKEDIEKSNQDAKNVENKIVTEIQKIAQDPVSLETPIGEEDDSHLGDFIQDDDSPAPQDAAAYTLLREQLEEVMKTLTPREAKVLKLRFGLEDGKSRTLEEVGKEFNVTRERIRQIEAKALRKLRHPSRSKKLKDYMN